MRIIYYSPHPHLNLASPSGYGTHMREMIKAFQAEGHTVLPVIAGGLQLEGDPLPPQGGGIKSALKKLIPSRVWETLKDLRLLRGDRVIQQELERHIREFQPDCIYERMNYLQTSGVKAATSFGIPHFYEMNAPYVQEKATLEGRSMLTRLARRKEAEQLTQTNGVFPVSSAFLGYLKEAYPELDLSKVKVVPNAINLEFLQVEGRRTDELRKGLGIGQGTVIGFVGSILKWHGVDILIRAFAGIHGSHPDCKLLIVGYGEDFREFTHLASDLGMQDHITFTGNVPHEEVPNYIDLMDITVMANTNWYGSPIKIFEYGAMGKAIIAPDRIPLRDVMVPDQDGILIEPGVKALSSALKRLLDDEGFRDSLAQHFQKRVLSDHVWTSNARLVSNVMEASTTLG